MQLCVRCGSCEHMSGGLKEGREEGKTQRTSYIASFNPYNIPGKYVLLTHFEDEETGPRK